MPALRISLFAATLLACLAAVPAVRATTHDEKAVSSSVCQPYGPDTTAAELQISQTGVYNPGTTIEKVVCPLPRDDQNYYVEGATALVVGYYRVLGGAPGRVTCTIFVGSTSMHSQAVTTATASGDLVANGERGIVQLTAPAQAATAKLVPNTMICALSPKTSLGAFYIDEFGPTDYVDPPV